MSEYKESCHRLQEAINALNHYIQKAQKTKFPLSKLLLSRISKGYAKKKQHEQESLQQTIDIIKSHRFLIYQLQQGNDEQKNLANTAMQTISRYNDILQKNITFLSRQPIELSLPISLSHKQVQKTAGTSDSSSRITLEEKTAFWMKGITLLKGVGNPYLTIARTQKEVLNAPITIDVDTLSKKMSLSTTLSPLPGEHYTFKGSFEPLPGKKRSLPCGFEITFEATQTAFPDPLQYLGFFSNAMIPPCPHREIEPLSKLLEKKARIAKALLPKGAYNKIAKEQLEQKKALFKQHRKELLPLHQQLLQHLIPQNTLIAILYEMDDPLEQLAAVYRQFAHLFIETPFHQLQHQWLENHQPLSLSEETAKTLQQLPKQTLLHTLGTALSAPCQTIMMQHLSENLSCPPPTLTDFETKIQSLLYRQLLTFFKEIEEKKTLTLAWIKSQMEAENALFLTPLTDKLTSEALQLCASLKSYFTSRYQALT